MNSRNLIIIILALTGFTNAIAQTTIPGGNVSGTWEASGSPYLIEGEITIPSGDSLVIEPGVDVIFQGHYKFIVNGWLEAIGTEQDSILFTPANTSEGWHGLRFIGAPDSSHLFYCTIQYGHAMGGGADRYGGGIYCCNSNPAINHCIIQQNRAETYGGGIFCDNCSPTIYHCTISGNLVYSSSCASGGGIFCWVNSSPIVSDCEIGGNSANNGGGIFAMNNSTPTLSNCAITQNSAIYNGGGILCSFGSSPTINSCNISDNSADWSGGGIFCSEDDTTIISYCAISDNWAGANGGGIFTDFSDAIIKHCTITGNSSDVRGGGIRFCRYSPALDSCTVSQNSAGEYGGGISCIIASPTISNCIITHNTADIYAGGIDCNDSSPTISHCTISWNTAGSADGGGISITNDSSPIISFCTIIANKSHQQHGGGITCSQSNPIISYCTIALNEANGNGGGMRYISSSPTIAHCSFTGNTAIDGYGGGIVCDQSTLTLTRCTLGGNSAYRGGGIASFASSLSVVNIIVQDNLGEGGIYLENSLDVSITYGDFFNNEGGDFTGNSIPPDLGQLVTVNTNGDSCDIFFNIFQDPCSISQIWSDYRLQWGSPCIDAGDPNPIYYDPDGTVADMGAYYYDQSVPVRILLTPHSAPIQIPPEGGSFNYTIQATNIDPLPQLVNIWCDAILPSGSVYGPVLGPVSVTLDSGVTIQRDRTQNVPAGAPEGIYSYNAYAVAGGDTSADSFIFVKLGGDGSDWISGWSNFGDSFDIESNVQTAPTLPLTYSLGQNYPNPFNPSTTILFSLPESRKVSLKIYDVTGRQVATLVNGWRKAGYHEVTFNGSDLASGIYLYRIETADYVAFAKMILLK